MRLTLLYVAAGAWLAACAQPARAVTPRPEEMSRLRTWMQGHLEAPAGEPPFSFKYDGRSSRELLKNWRRTRGSTRIGDRFVEHSVSFLDPETQLRLSCTFTEFTDFPGIEWVLRFENAGPRDTSLLEDVEALDATWPSTPNGRWRVHHALGDNNSADSFAPIATTLIAGRSNPLTFAPQGGRSSDGHMPFFNIESLNALGSSPAGAPSGTMTAGSGVAMAVGWSGQWQAEFGFEQGRELRVRAGMQRTHLVLHPGESIRTPRILLVFWDGPGPLRGENMLRQVLLAHYLPRRGGQVVFAPICGSVNVAEADGTYEGPHVRAMPKLAERGIEVFWSDMDPQHWYPGGFPDGTGTWEPDPAKYPRGLRPVGQAAHAAGLEYLLWFEPERVAPGTRIQREHPEWVIPPAVAGSGLFRLGEPAARAWLTEYIDTQIAAAQLDWVRWDFNIEPLEFWRRSDAPDRQGMSEIRHVEGLYAMWDELRARHPGLVIDNCASGGRRIDLETLSRGLPLWHSDLQCSGAKPAAEQLENAGLFRWVPLHGCGNFGYEPSYAFRSGLAAGNILCSSNPKGGLNTADADTADAVKRTVAVYKRLRPMLLGDFYPLFAHSADEAGWFGYQFHRADLDAGVVVLFRRERNTTPEMKVTLSGVSPRQSYRVRTDDAGCQLPEYVRDGALDVKLPSSPAAAILWYDRAE
jgi:alpha-galactosidase